MWFINLENSLHVIMGRIIHLSNPRLQKQVSLKKKDRLNSSSRIVIYYWNVEPKILKNTTQTAIKIRCTNHLQTWI